jgi:cell division protein FtsI/penicillin-binding protein 2
MEGRQFLESFYRKYHDRPESALNGLLKAHPLTPNRFAAMVRYVEPELSFPEFQNLAVRDSIPVRRNEMESLYTRFVPDRFNLNDQAYLAHVHPLELWLVAYLSRHPSASLEDVLAAGGPARQDAYTWLIKSTRKHAQDIRIRIVLEQDAFEQIHGSWVRLGFPFDRLVSSYATAIGSSGDNPEALATLAGIILNQGIRYPAIRIQKLHFAEGTPMETILERQPAKGERVMPEAVAAVLQRELIGVVENGTGQRARRSVVLANGRVIPVGGKTGTGDNRIERFGSKGAVLESKVRNRTAAFVFTIGDRFFGMVLAYSAGPDAAAERFTSALAVQVFRDIMPALRPLFSGESTHDAPASP